ncbi:hypothetical protein G9A89_000571 [Geosiphon pyriformis]|nr:hypothetical protein G9A89_000571 [Geosiphon pyriformis]
MVRIYPLRTPVATTITVKRIQYYQRTGRTRQYWTPDLYDMLYTTKMTIYTRYYPLQNRQLLLAITDSTGTRLLPSPLTLLLPSTSSTSCGISVYYQGYPHNTPSTFESYGLKGFHRDYPWTSQYLSKWWRACKSDNPFNPYPLIP